MTRSRYLFSEATAQRYLDRHGPEFKEALWDKTQTTQSVADRYGYDFATIHKLRVTIVPETHRTIRKHKVTAEMLAAFKTKATNEQLAERFKIPYPTMERMRRRHVGRRIPEVTRYTPQVMALLRSKFSNRIVAKALEINGRTVWYARVKLGIRTPKIRVHITDEQRAALIASTSDRDAGRRLGIHHTRAKHLRFLLNEGLL